MTRRIILAALVGVLVSGQEMAAETILCVGDIVRSDPGQPKPWERDWSKDPRFSSELCAKFDAAAKSMYRAECDCLTFLHKGKVDSLKMPLTPENRWWLFQNIHNGNVIPFPSKGSGY